MEIKTNIQFNVKTRIKCPKCQETFDKPTGDYTSLNCPQCGMQLKLTKEAVDEAIREAETKAAGTLGSMGIPLPEKYAGIAKAKTLTRPLNIIGVVASLWAFAFPVPYLPAILVCASIPVAAILMMAYLKGSINFETKKGKSEVPYLTFAIAMPPAVLAWRALIDFHIFSFAHVWVPAAAIAIFFSVLIFLLSADMKRKPLYILVALIFGFMYGYGVLIEANCLADKSMPNAYNVKVLGKRSSYSSRSRSYYIKVGPWGPRTKGGEISIRKSGYDRIRINDEIIIGLKRGFLDIPWFFIRLKS